MDVQLIRENIALERPIGTGRAQAVVEGDVMLPGGLREETHILLADAMAVVENAEAMQDRVSVGGRVVFHVLYTQGDPSKVNVIETAQDFMHLCELPGSQARAAASARAWMEKVDARVVNGRLFLRGEIGLQVQALSQTPVEAIVAVNGSDDAEVRTVQSSIRRTVAQGSSDVLLREEFELPEGLEITETFCAAAYPTLSDVSGGMGRIGLNGEVALEVYHASAQPGRPVVVTRHTMPVAQSVELAGEDGETLDGRITVKDVAVVSQDMGDGARMLRAEVLLGLSAWADRQETITVLADAYTTKGDDLRLTGSEMRVRTGDERLRTAESGKTLLLLPEDAPPVRTMLAASAVPVMSSWEQTGGRLLAEGLLRTTLLYMTDDSSAPISVRQETPFRAAFAAQAGRDAALHLSLTQAEAVPITSDRVELRYILHLDGEELQSAPLHLVTDAQSVAADQPTQDIVLYFTQPGESLWDIARRYRVPVDIVRELNPELSGEPKTGQGVIVWRRCGDEVCV